MESVVYRAAQALTGALGRPLGVVKETGTRTLHATVSVGRLHHELDLVWAGRGWPADIERVSGEAPAPWPRQLVVIGQRFSAGALDLLRERDANWVDETGAARIETDSGLFVVRTGVEEARSAAALRWGASAVDATELLLADPPDGTFNAADIAERSGWSHPQITKLLRQFNAQGWVKKVGGSRGVGSGWQFGDPDALLEAWAAHLIEDPPRTVLAHRTLREPMRFLRDDLARELSARMRWAVSGWAGLELDAPFVTATPVLHAYVAADAFDDGRLRAAMQATQLREVEEGARVVFRALSPVGLSLAHDENGIPVVSPPRLYADLRALGGRGEEAAAHVREELMRV
jgi:hypothetical protein